MFLIIRTVIKLYGPDSLLGFRNMKLGFVQNVVPMKMSSVYTL
jgi:hypothetical protein